MNSSKVAGSILTVFPVKKKKRKKREVFSYVQEAVKLTHSKTTMRAIRSLQVTPIPKKSEVKLDTGYLIGVPDIIWEKTSGSVGENVVENRV